MCSSGSISSASHGLSVYSSQSSSTQKPSSSSASSSSGNTKSSQPQDTVQLSAAALASGHDADHDGDQS